jgi:hypothetical protein
LKFLDHGAISLVRYLTQHVWYSMSTV